MLCAEFYVIVDCALIDAALTFRYFPPGNYIVTCRKPTPKKKTRSPRTARPPQLGPSFERARAEGRRPSTWRWRCWRRGARALTAFYYGICLGVNMHMQRIGLSSAAH